MSTLLVFILLNVPIIYQKTSLQLISNSYTYLFLLISRLLLPTGFLKMGYIV